MRKEKGKHLGKLREKLLNYETVSYLIAGVMTTLVDYVVFVVVNESLKRGAAFSEVQAAMAATVISWLAAVLFAYVTNKLLVFRNYDFHLRHLSKEISGFFAARLVSGLITMALMWLMVDLCRWNEYVAKILTSVFNMVFNYVASKLYIFKKN